jgi:hypothetical protein
MLLENHFMVVLINSYEQLTDDAMRPRRNELVEEQGRGGDAVGEGGGGDAAGRGGEWNTAHPLYWVFLRVRSEGGKDNNVA